MDDWYDILNLGRQASQEDVVAAFRDLARTCHPDKHPGNSNAAARFRRIEAAFDTLSDPQRRRQYDEQICHFSKCSHCRKFCEKPPNIGPSWTCPYCQQDVTDEIVDAEIVETFPEVEPHVELAPVIVVGNGQRRRRHHRPKVPRISAGVITFLLFAAAVLRGCFRQSSDESQHMPGPNGLASQQSPWVTDGSSNRSRTDIRELSRQIVHPPTQLLLHRPHDSVMAQIDGTPDWLAAPLTIVAEQASLDGKTFLFVKTPYLDHCVFLNEFYLWPPALYPTWTQVYRPAPIYANEYAHFVTYEDRIYFARRIGDSR